MSKSYTLSIFGVRGNQDLHAERFASSAFEVKPFFIKKFMWFECCHPRDLLRIKNFSDCSLNCQPCNAVSKPNESYGFLGLVIE